jgi:hypothetical protein
MLAMEKQNIQTMIDGKESRPAMVEPQPNASSAD